jgi:signal transduction histidine kinase
MFTSTRLKPILYREGLFFLMLFISIPKSHAFQVDSVRFSKNLEKFHIHKYANLDSAKYYLDELDILSQKDPKSPQRYRFYVTSGGWHRIKREITQAITAHKKAHELAKHLKNKEFIVKSQFNLGAAYGEISDYEKAINLFKQVEAGLGDVKTDPILFSNQFRANMVQFYVQTKDYPTAFKYSDQMKENLKTYDDSTMYYISRIQLLSASRKTKETVQFGEEFLKVLKPQDLHFRYQVYSLLGDSYSDLSDNPQALKNLLAAKELSIKLGIESGLVERSLGHLYFKDQDYKNALIQFNRVLYLAKKQGSPGGERLASKDLSDLYKAQGKYQDALKHMERYVILNDSLLGLEKIKAIQDTEARYELSDKEKTIEQQKKMNTLQEALLKEGNQRRAVLIGFLICAVLLAAALWFFYRKTIKTNKQLVVQRNQIENYAADLKSANQMRDKLFAIISHDLRSPVSSLVHSLENYVQGKPLNSLLYALNNVQLILNNLLKWAQIQLSEKPLRPKSIHLDWLLNSIIKQFTGVINEKQIQVATDFKHTNTVLADEEGLSIILRNIISNAVKFTGEEGFIRLTTKEENGLISVTIRDSGTGMSPEQLKTLYVYPESQTGTLGEKGTGLGMTLTRELIEKMNGQISVKSKQGVGTSIELTLPVFS